MRENAKELRRNCDLLVGKKKVSRRVSEEKKPPLPLRNLLERGKKKKGKLPTGGKRKKKIVSRKKKGGVFRIRGNQNYFVANFRAL